MTTQVQPRSYTCPKCGRVHTADLSAMEGHPEIHGKVHCLQCHALLWLSLAEDGTTEAELYEDHTQAAAARPSAEPESRSPEARPAPAGEAPAAAPGARSSLPGIVIAAVVAAVVSYLVGTATGSGAGAGEAKAKPEAEKRPDAAQLSALQADLEEVRSAAESAAAAHATLASGLQDAASANAEAMQELKGTLAEIKESLGALEGRLAEVEAAYNGLHGRIEMNYTNLRAAKKRLDALAEK